MKGRLLVAFQKACAAERSWSLAVKATVTNGAALALCASVKRFRSTAAPPEELVQVGLP